jgi:Carboxypeptidase regulatory-like domain
VRHFAMPSSGVVPGPAASTIISGLVLDDTDTPIPNATASIQGTNLSALTNAQGQFTIANAPVGDIVLYVNGATSTSPYTFPTLSCQMATIPGVNNTQRAPGLPACARHQ